MPGQAPGLWHLLGNQVISLAAGGQVEKLPYGHHGGNEPVMNLLTGKVEITAQNHNYGLVFPSLGELVPELSGATPSMWTTCARGRSVRWPRGADLRFGHVRLTT